MAGAGIKHEINQTLLKSLGLILISLFVLFSHVPLATLLHYPTSDLVSSVITWSLFATNIYVVVAVYLGLIWLSRGTEEAQKVQGWFGKNRFASLSLYALVWLLCFFVSLFIA